MLVIIEKNTQQLETTINYDLQVYNLSNTFKLYYANKHIYDNMKYNFICFQFSILKFHCKSSILLNFPLSFIIYVVHVYINCGCYLHNVMFKTCFVNVDNFIQIIPVENCGWKHQIIHVKYQNIVYNLTNCIQLD